MKFGEANMVPGRCDSCSGSNAGECEFCTLVLCPSCQKKHRAHCAFGKLHQVEPERAAPIRAEIAAGAKKEVA